jgi:hypothetical protein
MGKNFYDVTIREVRQRTVRVQAISGYDATWQAASIEPKEDDWKCISHTVGPVKPIDPTGEVPPPAEETEARTKAEGRVRQAKGD